MARRLLLPLAGALSALASATAAPAGAAQTQVIPMTADRWTLSDGVKIVEHLGVPAIEIPPAQNNPEAILKDVVFADGTIEVDLDGSAGLGPAIGFRRHGTESYELFYVRPKACPTAVDCVQYAPFVHGVLLWDLYPGLQRPARFVPNRWNHLKLVVSGRRLRVWVNGGEPALDVTRLEGEPAPGGIVLRGTGFSANLEITPGAVEGLPRKAGPDPTGKDSRIVRGWSISPLTTLADGAEPDVAARPTAASAWTPIAAETGGLVNISRLHGWPKGRSFVWLRTTIRAAKQTEARAAIGWNDEVWVYANGKPVYADTNIYLPAERRKKPDGRLSLENGAFTLPLQAGDNEIVVGVANAFFGWGLMLRLDDAPGVTLTASTR